MEGTDGSSGYSRSRQVPLDESKKDFWDSFGGQDEKASVGTAAMRKGGNGGGTSSKKRDDGDEWENW